MSKYVSLDNLTRYDGKIKDYINSSIVPTTEQRVTFLDISTECTRTNPFMISDRKGGIYCLYNSTTTKVSEIFFQFDSTKSPASQTLANNVNSGIMNYGFISFVFIKKDNYNLSDAIICFLNQTLSGATSSVNINNAGVIFNNNLDTYLQTNTNIFTNSLPNITYLNNAQTITGKKTFDVLPESSIVPTSNYQLVNKKYVDDNLPLDSKMVYVGKISEYDTAAKALDVANYPIGTRIILKHDGAKHTVFIKNTNRNTNAIEVELGDGATNYVPIDNIYYFDRNNEETTAITSTRAFCHGPVVTEWKQVKHPENDVPYIAASGQELIVRAPFRIEEDNSGNLSTSTLSDYTKIQRIGIQKTYPQQRMDVMYIDKDLNKYNMIIVEHSSSSEVLEGTCVSTRPLADGYYHNLKVQLTIIIDSTTSEYSSHTKTITDLGPIIQTQFTTMPTASSSTVGKIVQYTGITDSNYTNGYFYIGVTDGESTPTYSWSNISTQEIQITKASNSDIDNLFN